MPKSRALTHYLVVQARHLPCFVPHSSQIIHANDRLFLSSYILCNPGWSLLSMNEWSGPCPKYWSVSMKTRQPTYTNTRPRHCHLLLSGLVLTCAPMNEHDMPLKNPKRIRPMDTTPTRQQRTDCPWSGPVRSGPQMVQTSTTTMQFKASVTVPDSNGPERYETLYTLYISTTLYYYTYILLPYIVFL